MSAQVNGGDSDASGTGCAAGAGGAVVGEVIGDLYVESKQDDLDRLEQLLKDDLAYVEENQITDAVTLARLAEDTEYYFDRLYELQVNGANIARLGSAVSAFLVGADAEDVYIAANAGENAAENNALPALLWGAAAILSAVGTYFTAVEIKDLGEQILAAEAANDTETRDALLEDLAKQLGVEVVLVAVGGKALDALYDIYNKARLVKLDNGVLAGLEDTLKKASTTILNNDFDSVVDSIRGNAGALPDNFITKSQAKYLGWNPRKGNLQDVAPGKSIGGDIFGNNEGLLPNAPNRIWYEADINYQGGFRNDERLVYSSDGLFYKTTDHYKSFTAIE